MRKSIKFGGLVFIIAIAAGVYTQFFQSKYQFESLVEPFALTPRTSEHRIHLVFQRLHCDKPHKPGIRCSMTFNLRCNDRLDIANRLISFDVAAEPALLNVSVTAQDLRNSTEWKQQKSYTFQMRTHDSHHADIAQFVSRSPYIDVYLKLSATTEKNNDPDINNNYNQTSSTTQPNLSIDPDHETLHIAFLQSYKTMASFLHNMYKSFLFENKYQNLPAHLNILVYGSARSGKSTIIRYSSDILDTENGLFNPVQQQDRCFVTGKNQPVHDTRKITAQPEKSNIVLYDSFGITPLLSQADMLMDMKTGCNKNMDWSYEIENRKSVNYTRPRGCSKWHKDMSTSDKDLSSKIIQVMHSAILVMDSLLMSSNYSTEDAISKMTNSLLLRVDEPWGNAFVPPIIVTCISKNDPMCASRDNMAQIRMQWKDRQEQVVHPIFLSISYDETCVQNQFVVMNALAHSISNSIAFLRAHLPPVTWSLQIYQTFKSIYPTVKNVFDMITSAMSVIGY